MNDNKIGERRPWTEPEDSALKRLYQSLRINKWSHIAQQLEQEFGFTGRTGKQCRERYNNHLDPSLCRDQWTFAEEKRLYQLHDELGNKWAVISHKLGPGRTDNSVKNHFYSRLRKSLRRLNKVIQQKYKKLIREIQTKVLYKIIEASEEQFKLQPMCDAKVSEIGCKLKNKILLFSYDENELDQYKEESSIRGLIQQIIDFNKNYKRKPKKFRKLGAPSIEYMEDNQKAFQQSSSNISNLQNGSNISEFSQFNESFASFVIPSKGHIKEQQFEQEDEDQEDDINPVVKIQTHQQKLISPIILTGHPRLFEERSEREEKIRNSEQILQALGLLEDDISVPHPLMMKKKTSVMSSEHPQETEEFKFFQDSENEMRIMSAPNFITTKKESFEEKLFH